MVCDISLQFDDLGIMNLLFAFIIRMFELQTAPSTRENGDSSSAFVFSETET